MDLQLKGKTSIVTGGSAGIGLAIAHLLAEEGVEVIIPGRNLEKINAAIANATGVIQGIEVDLATADGAKKLIQSIPNASYAQAEKEFFEKHRPTSLLQRMADERENCQSSCLFSEPISRQYQWCSRTMREWHPACGLVMISNKPKIDNVFKDSFFT